MTAEAVACHGREGVREHAAAPAGGPVRGPAPAGLKGADVYTSPEAVTGAFPYLAPTIGAAMHTRNCGWVAAQTMGMDMLESLRSARSANGEPALTLLRGRVVGGQTTGRRLAAVDVEADGGTRTRLSLNGAFVNATGPFLAATHAALVGGSPLPVRNAVHAKVVFRDVLRVIPRDAPQVILMDAAAPLWAPGELEHVAEVAGADVASRAAASMPAGAHFRPYGGPNSDAVLLLWEAWHHALHDVKGLQLPEPLPPAADSFLDHELYPDICLRGLARVVPDLAAYFDEGVRDSLLASRRRGAAGGGGGADAEAAIAAAPRPSVDGGYYTSTRENLPLIGPAPAADGAGAHENVLLCGALSGFGIMAAHAAGELIAAHATGGSLPADYAPALSPLRYLDAEYMRPGGARDRLISGGGGSL